MALDYAYKIYVQKNRLKKTLQTIYDRSDKERTGFEIKEGQLYKLQKNLANQVTGTTFVPDQGIDQRIDCSLTIESDNKIVEYFLFDLTRHFRPDTADQTSRLDFYKTGENSFSIGNIEIEINNYHSRIPNTIEIIFWAATSDMSLLFENSPSIDRFFKELCQEISADFGCIFMEDNGYRLIWAQGREWGLTVPMNWKSFQEFGFIPVLKEVMFNQ